MATSAVMTPVRDPFSSVSYSTAAIRFPLTPSPRTPTKQIKYAGHVPSPSIHNGDMLPRFHRITSKTTVREPPKSNIARVTNSPRRLELGVSDWALTGTGTTARQTPGKGRPRPTKSSSRSAFAAADRFIPNRTASEGISNTGSGKVNFNVSHPKTNSATSVDGSSILANAAGAFDIGSHVTADDVNLNLDGLSLDDECDSPKYIKRDREAAAYESSLASACDVPINTRILAFKPAPPESSKPIDLRSQYNRPLRPASAVSAQFRRKVLTTPERVLDAPGLVDDYYLNLLDWSSGNQVAIGLERSVYVWSAGSGTVSELLKTAEDTYISSIKWSGDGAYVGVGLGTGEVQIWDVEERTKLRSMYGHDTRVGVMGWNKHILSTGARSGVVFNHDVRIAQHKTAELVSHTGEVCGLEWRSDGAQLATGGNDNLVNIWDARSLSAPKFTKTNHRAAVKALAWCPWQMNLLATGGGSHDRHIHFWNSTTGARTNSIDTSSQVTSLRWSTAYKEIVSSSGFPDNSLSIWSYPTLVKNVEIPAHESRVLHSCLSPDGQVLATAAADESLKFWKVFEKKPGMQIVARDAATNYKPSKVKQITIR